jgi:hypothetical protein
VLSECKVDGGGEFTLTFDPDMMKSDTIMVLGQDSNSISMHDVVGNNWAPNILPILEVANPSPALLANKLRGGWAGRDLQNMSTQLAV